MSGILYRKYVNIQLFIKNYRKFISDDPYLNKKQFKKTIQLEHHIKIKCRNPKTGRLVYIYLMKADSKYVKSTPNFKKLMESLGNNPSDVYLITKTPLSIYINKVLHHFPTLRITNFLHRHFSIEITKGPLCSKHTILTNEEVIKTCFQDLMIHPLSIPPIFISDPICLWIGAEIGQVIKIESYSENSGLAIRYRIVSPKVGRIPISKTPTMDKPEFKKSAEVKNDDADVDDADVDVDDVDDADVDDVDDADVDDADVDDADAEIKESADDAEEMDEMDDIESDVE